MGVKFYSSEVARICPFHDKMRNSAPGVFSELNARSVNSVESLLPHSAFKFTPVLSDTQNTSLTFKPGNYKYQSFIHQLHLRNDVKRPVVE